LSVFRFMQGLPSLSISVLMGWLWLVGSIKS